MSNKEDIHPDIDVDDYGAQFKNTAKSCLNSLSEQRSCKDICCLVIFITYCLVFIGGGIYFIVTLASAKGNQTQSPTTNNWASSSYEYKPSKGWSWHHDKEAIQHKNLQNSRLLGMNQIHDQQNHLYTREFTEQHDFLKNRHQYQGNYHYQSGLNNIDFINSKFVIVVISMVILSIVLSIVSVIALSKVPQYLVYAMAILITILILAAIIVSFILGKQNLTAFYACLAVGVVWGIIVAVFNCCFKQKFKIAITLIKIAGNFLKKNPTVVLAPVIMGIISLIFFSFWIVSLVGIIFYKPNSNQNNQNNNMTVNYILGTFWLYLNVFFNYFLYYVQVFLIATATAIWYYGDQGNFVLKGFKNIWNAHLGSLTFASILSMIIDLIKKQAQSKSDDQVNCCGRICICFLKCCLQMIQKIIKVLNHNSVIVMSVTGQSFIGSAKTTIFLIFDNFAIFVIIEMVQVLIKVFVVFFVVVIPTGLGVGLLFIFRPEGNQQFIIYGGVAILLICILISTLIITLISEALSCIFIFYCLDSRLQQLQPLNNYINYGGDNMNMAKPHQAPVNKGSQQIRKMFLSITQSQDNMNNSLYTPNGNDNNGSKNVDYVALPNPNTSVKNNSGNYNTDWQQKKPINDFSSNNVENNQYRNQNNSIGYNQNQISNGPAYNQNNQNQNPNGPAYNQNQNSNGPAYNNSFGQIPSGQNSFNQQKVNSSPQLPQKLNQVNQNQANLSFNPQFSQPFNQFNQNQAKIGLSPQQIPQQINLPNQNQAKISLSPQFPQQLPQHLPQQLPQQLSQQNPNANPYIQNNPINKNYQNIPNININSVQKSQFVPIKTYDQQKLSQSNNNGVPYQRNLYNNR